MSHLPISWASGSRAKRPRAVLQKASSLTAQQGPGGALSQLFCDDQSSAHQGEKEVPGQLSFNPACAVRLVTAAACLGASPTSSALCATCSGNRVRKPLLSLAPGPRSSRLSSPHSKDEEQAPQVLL